MRSIGLLEVWKSNLREGRSKRDVGDIQNEEHLYDIIYIYNLYIYIYLDMTSPSRFSCAP